MDAMSLTPDYSPSQREELARIDYLIDEIKALLARGILPAESLAAVEADKAPRVDEIHRLGLAAGAMKSARAVAAIRPAEALAFAEHARDLAPEQPEIWMSCVELLSRLDRADEAIEVCRRAIDERGHVALEGRLATLREQAARRRDDEAARTALVRADLALAEGNPEEAFAASRLILGRDPRNVEGLVVAIRSLIALDRLQDAEIACSVLRNVRPSEAVKWIAQVRALVPREQSHVAGEVVFVAGPELAGDRPVAPKPAPFAVTAQSPGWSSMAAEFLEDHWQKLLLALAVLLIVVSSTVGAVLLLGERLRMAEGKCLLATAYTLMFAAFGRVMVRWGAKRAGRVMRLTTLIVLPVSFALVGELPGLGRSSSWSMAVLAIDSAAMMGLIWLIGRALGLSGGRAVTLGLIALGMVNALTTRSISMPLGLLAMVGAMAVYAATAEWLAWTLGRTHEPDAVDEDDAPYFAFGLLTFYFACAIGRIGGYVLNLPPTLYALPVMLAAASAVRVSYGLRAAGRTGRAVASLQLAGFAASALAFALGLARPRGFDPLYSGNTVAAAVLGLVLYGRALSRERKPAYLYASFAALLMAYFGSHLFIKDLLHAVEGSIAHTLGYGRRLPLPFRAMNGLPINAFLVGLSLFFARRWNDTRLARHAYRIGLAGAITACVLSAFEPLAGVLVMGGYAIGFGVATWVFATPSLEYLACLALGGAIVMASTYLGDAASGTRALAIAAVGAILWGIGRILISVKVAASFREPVLASARVASAVALAFAAWSAWPSGPILWMPVAALWVLAILYILIGYESPRLSLAYAVVSCAAVAAILSTRLVAERMGHPIDAVSLAIWGAGLATFYQTLSPCLARLADRRDPQSSRVGLYPMPLVHLGLILSGFATATLGRYLVDHVLALSTLDLFGIAATMFLTFVALTIASIRLRDELTLHALSVLAGACAVMASALAVFSWRGIPPSPMVLGLTGGGLSLLLAGLGDRIRHRTTIYRETLLAGAFLAVGFAWCFGGIGWIHARALAMTLTMTALTLALLIRQRPVRPLPELALATGLAAWLVGCGMLVPLPIAALPTVGFLILVYAISSLAVVEILRLASSRENPGVMARLMSEGVPEFAGVAALIALVFCVGIYPNPDYRILTVNLALAAVVFLWLARFRGDVGLIHLGLGLVSLATFAATRWSIGPRPDAILLGSLALAAAVDGLLLVVMHWAGRWMRIAASALAPLRDVGIVLAAATFALSLVASVRNLDSYPLAVSALLLLSATLVASAVLDRGAWRTYAALVVGIAAAYLTMFELGRGQHGHVSSLGVLASLLALACWTIERATARSLRDEWLPIFRRPALDTAIALAVLAIIPEWDSPRALLLAALPFLLLVKSLPRPEWLYPAFGLVAAAIGFAIFPRWGETGLMRSAVVSSFVLWGLGWCLWRAKTAICRAIRLPDSLAYELPAYHLAIFMGIAALGLDLARFRHPDALWTAHAWLPATVGVLALLMLKPYPFRGWLDAFVGLTSLSAIALLAPSVDQPMTWGLILLTTALIWRMAEWGALPLQSAVCKRLGIGYEAIGTVLGQWSLGLLAIGVVPVVLRIGSAVLAATISQYDPLPITMELEWWAGLVAILLFAANLDLARRKVRLDASIGPHATATMLLWWLAIPASPLMIRLHLDPAIALPLVTVAQACASAMIGIRWGSRTALRFGAVLSLVAVVLTGGVASPATTATLFLAAIVQGSLAVRFRSRAMASLASSLLLVALAYASWNAASYFQRQHSTVVATIFAVSETIGAVGLISFGSWDRRRGIGLARIAESFGLAAVSLAALGVAMPTFFDFGYVNPTQALVNVGVMFATASLCVLMASRLGSIPLAFLAQAAIVFGYVAFRSAFALPAEGDSTAMLILAGVDLGIAEVAGRARRRLFALPALATALALPLVSVGLALRHGVIGDESLFILFAAATFYAASCGRMRWKSLGYGAALLYNAALWVLWSRFGWQVATDPQFFLVPVGFSTILFAEANRRELGHTHVNTVRGVGLTLIYLSLAVPVWQTASFTAWATILVVSTAGVFAGIALRSQAFLWLGLAGFVLDVVYQLGRIGMDHALAKWAIMLGLGLSLFAFVALNEKKKLMATLRKYVEVVRAWD
jgi:tetratricopeptide (TPR) repeat protein